MLTVVAKQGLRRRVVIVSLAQVDGYSRFLPLYALAVVQEEDLRTNLGSLFAAVPTCRMFLFRMLANLLSHTVANLD
jgi:hypothetical protein